MPTEETKAIYLSLKESGDLRNLFPGMAGNWEKDEKKFTIEYNKNERVLEDLEIDDFEEDIEIYF